MGASGSAWIKHKKQPHLRAAALSDVPHPRMVRTGQRYFPLDGRARNPVTLRVVRVAAGACDARREDAAMRIVRIEAARLLAADEHGAGLHYRFLGHAARVSYRTHACVVELDGGWARLICPEWHPGVPITVAAGGLPPALRHVGAWVACKANLGAAAPAATGLHGFMTPVKGFDPAELHAVALPEPARPRAPRADAGDIVLFLPAADVEQASVGAGSVYLTGHPPATEAGRRAYVCVDGEVIGWRAVAGTRPLPNGTRILLAGPWHPVRVRTAPALPSATVDGGRFGHQFWTRPTWRREDELDAA